MRATTIRFLDYWLGVPACGLLTVIRRIRSAFAKASADRERPRQGEGGPHGTHPQRILFLKFIEQGATVLAQDAIRRAAREVGRDHVYFCVFESNRAILDVLDTVPAAQHPHDSRSRAGPVRRRFPARGLVVRSHKIDTVIDMEFFSRASAIFAFLTGAGNRVGLHRYTGELPYRGDLMTHRVQYLPHLHISVQYSFLVEALFHDPDEEPLLKVPLYAIRADALGEPPRFVPVRPRWSGCAPASACPP